MSDTQSLNTLLLEVMISSKNERVFIRDLSDLTLQIIFDAWWASMNVGSKWPIAWKNSRHAPLWRFYWHCGIEEPSPGMICIVCHQVLRHPSEHGTSSMGKHLLAKAHIAKLNELTESEVVLATGPGNPPAVRVLTGGSVRFGLLPGQKPEPGWLGGFVTRTGHKPAVFWPGCTRTAVPFCGSLNFRSN
jgi:hypothetical protein